MNNSTTPVPSFTLSSHLRINPAQPSVESTAQAAPKLQISPHLRLDFTKNQTEKFLPKKAPTVQQPSSSNIPSHINPIQLSEEPPRLHLSPHLRLDFTKDQTSKFLPKPTPAWQQPSSHLQPSITNTITSNAPFYSIQEVSINGQRTRTVLTSPGTNNGTITMSTTHGSGRVTTTTSIQPSNGKKSKTKMVI